MLPPPMPSLPFWEAGSGLASCLCAIGRSSMRATWLGSAQFSPCDSQVPQRHRRTPSPALPLKRGGSPAARRARRSGRGRWRLAMTPGQEWARRSANWRAQRRRAQPESSRVSRVPTAPTDQAGAAPSGFVPGARQSRPGSPSAMARSPACVVAEPSRTGLPGRNGPRGRRFDITDLAAMHTIE